MSARGTDALGAAASTRDRAPVTRDEARHYCRRFVRAHDENFTVASWLLPRRLLPHFCSIYAYCRFADDLADELGDPQQSLAALDWWESELERCYAGSPHHPVFVALQATIEEFSIPREPFSRLLTAFRQDQRTVRYRTHDDVLGYCRNSADPVGRLILYLGRSHDARRGELSDSICTGLQLINFCQDVARDWRRGRLYLPLETLEQAGCSEADFAALTWTAQGRPRLSVGRCASRWTAPNRTCAGAKSWSGSCRASCASKCRCFWPED